LLKVRSKPQPSLSGGPAPSVILPVGYLQITWRREEGSLPSDAFVAVTKVPIVSAEEPRRSLTLITDLPPCGQIGEAVSVSYTVGNPTSQVVEVSTSLESTELFMFSGFRSCTFRLLPYSSHKLTFNCYPTQSGRHSLPLFHVHDRRQETPQSVGPISMFINPARHS